MLKVSSNVDVKIHSIENWNKDQTTEDDEDFEASEDDNDE